MKRYILIIALCVAAWMPTGAQEKYNVVLEQCQRLSPYEAIYLLMDYQYWRPELAAVYYELGNLCYDLLPTRDPLHHYPELSTLLYQSRLFYGNCLHFAKDQRLPGWQYEKLARGEKKIEYEQLERYIRPRMEEVQRQQRACDSIHNTFCRMSERYNRCQSLFSAFLSRYTREKTAHWQLQPDERALLLLLRQTADSVDADIEAYRTALTLQEIEGYHPTFRKEEIVLYRLDGLTYTDFLQNDIALWDYSRWVTRFMDEQTNVYERLYTDLEREYEQLEGQISRYNAGRPISGRYDESLTGRCKRLGLQNGRTDSVAAMQATVRHGAAEQLIAKSGAPQSMREFIPLLQIAANEYSADPDSAQRLIAAHLIRMAQPLRIQQQATYTHPITGETIQYSAEKGEEVVCLLPDDTDYRCVVQNGDETEVLRLTRDMTSARVIARYPGERAYLYTKIPGNQWILITDSHLHVHAVR